jgi:hypothetical protein
MQTFSERAMSGAFAVLLDPKTAEEERTDAAWVVRGLHGRVPLTEGLLANVGRAVRCNLDAPGALARLLVVLQARGVDTSRTKNAVARAAEGAFRQNCLPGLHTLVLAAFDDPAWSEIARDEYGEAAFAWAVSDLPAQRTAALMLVGGWIRLRNTIPEWLGREIRRRPTLVASLRPPVWMAWRLHASAPTAKGWRYVLSIDTKGELFAPEAFGASLDDAMNTLGEAIAEEPDATARVVLGSWLSRLGG